MKMSDTVDAAAGQEDPKKAQLELELKKCEQRLSDWRRVMIPGKVYCLGLADYVGAYWWTSRLRVAAAFYCHVFMLIVTLLLLAVYGIPSDFTFLYVVLPLAVTWEVHWWLDVVHDHYTDDLKTLQRNIMYVQQQIELVTSLSQQLQRPGPLTVAQLTAADTLTGFQSLLGVLLAFEQNYDRQSCACAMRTVRAENADFFDSLWLLPRRGESGL